MMKFYNKIIFCLLLIFITGCSVMENSKENDNSTILSDNDFGFTVILSDRSITIDNKIDNINNYIGDNYTEIPSEDSADYYNSDIQVTLDANQQVKEIILLSNKYNIEGNVHVGSNVDELKNIYKNQNYSQEDTKFIAYNENHMIKITYELDDKVNKITITENK